MKTLSKWLIATAFPMFSFLFILRCCQTNEPKHQYSFDEYVHEVTKERHSVRAASRLSLNVLRLESDL